MRTILRPAKPLSFLLIIALLSLSLPHQPAQADLVATESAIAGAHDAEAKRARVRTFLEREDVQAQLEAYGIGADEARARVDSLTDDEVAVIAGKLDELPAGGYVPVVLFGPPSFAAAAAFIGVLVLVVVLIVWLVKHRSSKNTAVEKAD